MFILFFGQNLVRINNELNAFETDSAYCNYMKSYYKFITDEEKKMLILNVYRGDDVI